MVNAPYEHRQMYSNESKERIPADTGHPLIRGGGYGNTSWSPLFVLRYYQWFSCREEPPNEISLAESISSICMGSSPLATNSSLNSTQ
ncbi:hypothetical protein SAMN05443144_12361 [Fodinibius roseus]|uniref:Uncharacterized protein n=1 Tax=Fodinibius roseus TaxID=1194090 RepID=A0A1M5IIF6_9BACT|nr:hypothetical protein SAMN05443144_12361 [Fodinibius roseus]